MVSRRNFLAGVGGSAVAATGVLGGVLFGGWSGRDWQSNSADHSPITDGPTVALDPVAEGFTQPLALCNPIENHLYIADKFGQIYHYLDGELRETPILDISDKLVMDHGEQGLLGLEFHPDFESNRRFYVRYSSPPRDGTPDGYSHTFVLSEFRMTNDYRDVVSDSERPILEIPEPGRMHNSGSIEFGPDGYLYVTIGDGGGDGHDGAGPFNRGPDSHSGDWYWPNVGGNGQDVKNNPLGSVLRIDVDSTEGQRAYGIPKGNPLTDKQGLEEHYAWGFRNPYSLSFDGEDMYVADVGTKLYEEVNLVEKGGNYGWNVREGLSCHNNFPPLRALSAVGIDVRTFPACPKRTPDGTELEDPVIALQHPPAVAVIGGFVCRETGVEGLADKYVFGDLSGRLFASQPASSNELWEVEEISVASSDQSDPSKLIGSPILSIEPGRNGEVYCLTAGQDGKVQRVVEM